MLFTKPNCTLCYFVEIEFKRAEILFSNSQKRNLLNHDREQNSTGKISFYIIDCSRYERKCSTYDVYGVPTIILTDKRREHIFRYDGEKSALCERLTSFIIDKTNIHPRNKYYLEKYDEIMYDNGSKFEEKIDKLLYHTNELNVVNISYIHQFNNLININKIVSTGRCVALALPIQGVIPISARIIFDYFFRDVNFFPIVIPNKNSYKIEETLISEIGIILFTNRGEFPVFINNTIPNIIDIINYFCFIEGSQKLRKFIEMLINDDTEKTVALIERSLKDSNVKTNKNFKVNLSPEQKKQSASLSNISSAKITSFSPSQTKFNESEKIIIIESSSNSQFSDSPISISGNQMGFSSEYSNQVIYKLPYEFRYFAEEPIKLISFAKMMYAGNDLERIIYTIEQLRKSIIHDKIGKSVEEKLSQRIIVLKVIKQIFLERLFKDKF